MGTAERLASTTTLPVLVVRDDGAFVAWGSGQPLRVLLGVDESAATASAVKWVEQLRTFAPIDVVVGPFYYPDEAAARYGLGPRVSFTESDPALEALIRRDLKRRVPHLEGKGEVTYRARLGIAASQTISSNLQKLNAARCWSSARIAEAGWRACGASRPPRCTSHAWRSRSYPMMGWLEAR